MPLFFTGLAIFGFVIWLINQMWPSKDVRERRKRKEDIKEKDKLLDIDIDLHNTEQRFNEKRDNFNQTKQEND